MRLVKASLHSSNMANPLQEVHLKIGVRHRPGMQDSILLKILASILLSVHSLHSNMDNLHLFNRI
jgi:hypothetical protein